MSEKQHQFDNDLKRSGKDATTRLYLSAVMTGVLVGLTASVFHFLLDRIELIREYFVHQLSGSTAYGWSAVMLAAGIMITTTLWLVRRFAPETCGSGIPEVEGTLQGIRSLRWQRVIPVKFVGGLLAIGSGLVLGREGPTIQMGAALGKMTGKLCRLSAGNRNTLIAAAAGAGLTAAFGAPFAGIIFVIEEMRAEFNYNFASFNSVVLACCIAQVITGIFWGQSPFLSTTDFNAPPVRELGLFLVLGCVIGCLGVLFNRMLFLSMDLFDYLKNKSLLLSGALAGAGTGGLIWFYPDSMGSGDTVVELVISHQTGLGLLAGLLCFRLFTTVLSYGIGVPGGIFAPMLALGTLAGMTFASTIAPLFPNLTAEPGSFAIAAMAALFAATVQAPLTGIILVLELTGNHHILPAVILTSMAAGIVAHAMGGKPVYQTMLQRTLAKPSLRSPHLR